MQVTKNKDEYSSLINELLEKKIKKSRPFAISN
jgi:hypothetical protein